MVIVCAACGYMWIRFLYYIVLLRVCSCPCHFSADTLCRLYNFTFCFLRFYLFTVICVREDRVEKYVVFLCVKWILHVYSLYIYTFILSVLWLIR